MTPDAEHIVMWGMCLALMPVALTARQLGLWLNKRFPPRDDD